MLDSYLGKERVTAELYLFDTCTHKCGYCWLAENGNVLDFSQLERFRDAGFIASVQSFFLSRTTKDRNWLLILTGGEPLIAPNLEDLMAPLLEGGNQMAYYTALLVGANHPGFRFLLKHPYPTTDYVMVSLHPESEADEPRFFAKIRALKDAGHRVYVRFVAHPKRLHRLEELSERCRDLDICFYPTTLLSNRYPGAYEESEKALLQNHFSSLSQFIQLEGGLDTDGLTCSAGSRIISVNLQTGDITPCITVHKPSLGNLFADRLEWTDGPTLCPEPGINCVCDIHFQQNIVGAASDHSRFVEIGSRFAAPRDYRNELKAMKSEGMKFYAKPEIGIGSVSDDNRLFYTIEEVGENLRRARNLPRSVLNRPHLREIEGALLAVESCDARVVIHGGWPAVIQTLPDQWSWAASIPIQLPTRPLGEVWLRIQAIVSEGETGFGILNQRTDSFQDRCFVRASPDTQTVYLRVLNPVDARSLIVENSTCDGRAAKLQLESVTVLEALT